MKKSMMLLIVFLATTISCYAFECAPTCSPDDNSCYVPSGMTRAIPCEDRYLQEGGGTHCKSRNRFPYDYGYVCKTGYVDENNNGYYEITEDGYCETSCGVKTCWGVTCYTDFFSSFATCFIWPWSGQEQ